MHVPFATKVTKGQINNGSISQNELHKVYKECAKVHAFIKKCIIYSFSLSMLLYYFGILQSNYLQSPGLIQGQIYLTILKPYEAAPLAAFLILAAPQLPR